MIPRVADGRVWSTIRWLYIGSGLLFLANISLGILNVFTVGEIPRGQVLSHLHSGTIGWITLSVVATTFWVYTGERVVSEAYVRFLQGVTIVGLLAVPGYVMGFGAAFNGDGPFWLLPLFGIPTGLVIVASFVFAAMQLKHQAVVTTTHLLFFGALLVASLGASMGVLWGLTYETGAYPYPSGAQVNPIGAHAGPMDMYLALAFAGLVELMLHPGDRAPWTKSGMAQMILGVFGAFVISGALYVGAAAIIPLALLSFLATFVVYVVRIGWRTFHTNPFGPGTAVSLFFGGLWFPVYIGLFVFLVAAYFVPGKAPPEALLVAFVHITFVGTATNLLLAAQSAYAGGREVLAKLQPVAGWLLNLGLVAFIAGEYMAGRREGALVMAVGVLLSLGVVWARLGRHWMPLGREAPT